METTEGLRNRIRTAEDLHSVVRTMKALAAVSIRQYERAVEALSVYNRTVELGFQVLVRRRPEAVVQVAPEDEGAVVAIVFGTDQGMCGPLNREIAEHATAWFDHARVPAEDRFVAAVGGRVAAELEGTGQPVADTFALPSSVSGLVGGAEDVLLAIEQWREARAVARVTLFHHRPRAGASYQPRTVPLLPIDADWLVDLGRRRWPTVMLPTFTMDWDRLFTSLVRQYLFGALFRAFAESLASENASRLASMQAAEKNIQERIDQLRLQFHQRRQSAITEELLDVVAGFEVLSQERA